MNIPTYVCLPAINNKNRTRVVPSSSFLETDIPANDLASVLGVFKSLVPQRRLNDLQMTLEDNGTIMLLILRVFSVILRQTLQTEVTYL